jgi:hypothetical protein
MKRLFQCIYAFSLFVLLACLTVYWVHLDGRTLVEHSVPVADARVWKNNGEGFRAFRWIDNRRFFSYDGITPLHAPFCYDVVSRAKVPLTGLEKLFDYAHSKSYQVAASWELSLDRAHVLWNINNGDFVHYAALDGSNLKTWVLRGQHQYSRFDGMRWLADGRRWIARFDYFADGTRNYTCIGNVEESGSARLEWIPKSDTNGVELADPVLHVNIWYSKLTHRDQPGFPISLVKGKSVQPPTTVDTIELTASPDRTHLAWLLDGANANPLSTFIHRICPSYNPKPSRYRSISVSHIDGSHIQEVGRIDEDGSHAPDDMINSLQWMPDGKHVSYVCKNVLYSLDVTGEL